MNAREHALWGLIGALAFLVLHQGYLLVGGETLPIPVVAGVAALVGVAAGSLTYLLGERTGRV